VLQLPACKQHAVACVAGYPDCSCTPSACLVILQAELMYRRNKEEVEGLQAKRKQVGQSST
jgi:hypothetical protein